MQRPGKCAACHRQAAQTSADLVEGAAAPVLDKVGQPGASRVDVYLRWQAEPPSKHAVTQTDGGGKTTG
eukprot:5013274-Prymnesium_polylepis.2